MNTATISTETIDKDGLKDKLANIKLCVFDMAGTTVDEDNLVYKTVRDAINEALKNSDKADKQVDLDLCLEHGAGKEKRTAIHDILSTLDVDNGRPAPDMITLAMDKFDIDDSQQVLKAGDSGIDIEEGKNANCGLVIGVLSGAQNQQQLDKYAPDAVLNKLTDLSELL